VFTLQLEADAEQKRRAGKDDTAKTTPTATEKKAETFTVLVGCWE